MADNEPGKPDQSGNSADQNPDEPAIRKRLEVQLRLILSSLPNVSVFPPDWEKTGEVDFLYREGVVLVRDEDLSRVQEVLPGRVNDALIQGLTSYSTQLPTIEALEVVDKELGVGVATPDHVLYVTVRSFCPATEPAVPAIAEPDPAVSTDDCDGAGVRVSVVDTGWWPPAEGEHSWLAGVTGDIEQPFDSSGEIRPYGGHGTFAAGVLRSVAPNSTVRIEGILPAAGAWFESDIVRQLYDALAWAPDVISLQAGTTTRRHAPLLAFQVLYETRLAHMPGTVLVCAAGNYCSTEPFWPAAFEWATAVGGLNKTSTAKASWSNHGPWVDVYARGEDIVNAYLDGTFVTQEPQTPRGEVRVFSGMAEWSGTSFSTPWVAGVIAARASKTGESGRLAADAIFRQARRHALRGVGPVVQPWMACPDPDDEDGDDCCPGCWRHERK